MAFGHELDERRRRTRIARTVALATGVGMGWLLQRRWGPRRVAVRRPFAPADLPAARPGRPAPSA